MGRLDTKINDLSKRLWIYRPTRFVRPDREGERGPPPLGHASWLRRETDLADESRGTPSP